MSEKDDKNESNVAGPASPEPSHIMTGNYVVLMETNEKECESWYFFIRYVGNEDALAHLQKQLEYVEWRIMDDLSTFDLDLDHKVLAITAKQMTKLELNHHSFHRKFDGKLKRINLGLKKRDSTRRKIEKVFDLLGYGQIEDYIDDEDLDPDDLTDNEQSNSDSESDTESGSDSYSEEDQASRGKRGVIPPILLNSERPRWTRSKGFSKGGKR